MFLLYPCLEKRGGGLSIDLGCGPLRGSQRDMGPKGWVAFACSSLWVNGKMGQVELWSQVLWVLLPSLPSAKSANFLAPQFLTAEERNGRHHRIVSELLFMSRGSFGEGPALSIIFPLNENNISIKGHLTSCAFVTTIFSAEFWDVIAYARMVSLSHCFPFIKREWLLLCMGSEESAVEL